MSQEHSKEELDKVIERVQKILARKTDKGASEAEAETAMRIAQGLMAKYNLDMAVIEAAQTAKNQPMSVERVKEEFKGRAMYKWQRQLAQYVAEANFCYHLSQKVEKYIPGGRQEDGSWKPGRLQVTYKNLFVGRRGNVITAQLMYQYLTQTVEDLLPITDNAQRLSRSAMSWKEGCADRLCERLAKKRQDLMDEHDARMKAEAAAAKAASDATYKAKPLELEPNKEAEIKHGFAAVAAEAHRGHSSTPEEVDRPEVEEGDMWNPADAAKAPEPTASTALVLASVYDKAEHEANYETAWGLEPGTLARRRAEREERERKAAEEEAKAEMDNVEKPVKEETERQKAARERREAEEAAKRRRKWAREDDAAARREAREWAKKDHAMYRAGAEAGKKIGIDVQVDAKAAPKQLKGKD